MLVANSSGNKNLPVVPSVEAFDKSGIGERQNRTNVGKWNLQLAAMGMAAEHKVPVIGLQIFFRVRIVRKDDAWRARDRSIFELVERLLRTAGARPNVAEPGELEGLTVDVEGARFVEHDIEATRLQKLDHV